MDVPILEINKKMLEKEKNNILARWIDKGINPSDLDKIVKVTPSTMTKYIELIAERGKHKPLKITFFNTPAGRYAMQREKENLERMGYSVTIK